MRLSSKAVQKLTRSHKCHIAQQYLSNDEMELDVGKEARDKFQSVRSSEDFDDLELVN
jgi:hypothetical protein